MAAFAWRVAGGGDPSGCPHATAAQSSSTAPIRNDANMFSPRLKRQTPPVYLRALKRILLQRRAPAETYRACHSSGGLHISKYE
jgi:hypothetical protein